MRIAAATARPRPLLPATLCFTALFCTAFASQPARTSGAPVRRSVGRNVMFNQAAKKVQKLTKGKYPAPTAILECAKTGLAEGHAAGSKKEASAPDCAPECLCWSIAGHWWCHCCPWIRWVPLATFVRWLQPITAGCGAQAQLFGELSQTTESGALRGLFYGQASATSLHLIAHWIASAASSTGRRADGHRMVMLIRLLSI